MIDLNNIVGSTPAVLCQFVILVFAFLYAAVKGRPEAFGFRLFILCGLIIAAVGLAIDLWSRAH